jgi:Zn-dependent protease with chaperone function
VKTLAAKIDALAPENIVVGLDTTFFVIKAEVKCLAATLKGRTMYLSLPLCRILNEGELTSIVGHELGHFKGEDTRFSRRFYPIYRGATDAIASLERMRSESAMAIALIPVLSVLSYFFESFATAESEIGRQRELAADQVGATVSNPQNAASALVKVHAFSDCWQSALQRMRETINVGNPVNNVSAMFAGFVVENSSQAILIGLENQSLPHPMDTHPPLNVRLQAIGVSISEVESAALDTSPQGSAAEMIDDYEKLEKELTKVQQTLMEKAGEVRVNAQKKCRACARPNPLSADTCSCGFNFRRYLG